MHFLKLSEQPRGITHVEAGLGDIFRYDRSSSDNRTIANRDRKDGGVCTDTHLVPNFGGSPIVWR